MARELARKSLTTSEEKIHQGLKWLGLIMRKY